MKTTILHLCVGSFALCLASGNSHCEELGPSAKAASGAELESDAPAGRFGAGSSEFGERPADGDPDGAGRGPFPFPDPLVDVLDPDGDSEISAEEIAAAAERLKKLDRNKDGKLAGEEILPFGGGPPGLFRFGGGRGPGGPFGGERKLVKEFDRDGNGRLNTTERQAARDSLKKERGERGGGRGFGPRGGPFPEFGPLGEFGPPGRFAPPGDSPPGGPEGARRSGPPRGFGGREREAAKPGPRVTPKDVRPIPDAPLYEPEVVRTLFLEFENDDWEAELADFHRSDVEVPATLIVDGKTYSNVGVHFRGMSSYGMVGPGSKRSLNVSLNFVDPKQRLYGYKTLNLLNAHEDPSFLHTVLYSHIARQYIPAPKANLVKVVINGESWGVYVNAQQFNKEFLADFFPSTKGVRWKVPGSPGGRGGLEYLGENIEDYKRRYDMKTDDGENAWRDLIALCRTLNETPADQLEEALTPILDIDGVLWFLAVENVLINSDGYWIRASDYSLFRDEEGKFHVIPHDMNEAFKPAMGPGFFRGSGSAGVELDPLVGLDDPTKPLRSRLLAVPSLRARYLECVRTIADEWLDWNSLGPVVKQYRELIAEEIETDTRKLSSYAAFQIATGDRAESSATGRRLELSLRTFAQQRRDFLLNHPEIKRLAASR